MFLGIKYLLSYCWKFNPKYVILLFVKQIINVFFVYFGLIMPQYILDSVFVLKEINVTWKYVFIFIIISVICNVFLNFIINIITIERMKTFKHFQLFLGKKMMSAKFEDIESEEFLDLRSKAEKFLYGNGNGFGSILENAIDLIGKAFSLLTIISVIAVLDEKLVIILGIIVVLNSVVTGLNQKINIKINLEKAVQERRSSYFMNLFQDFRYGKEIRVYNIVTWLLEKYSIQLKKMVDFYEKMAKTNMGFGTLNLIISNFQLLISYIYVVRKAFRGIVSIGEFTKYLTAINTFSSTLKDIIYGVINIQQYTDYYKAYKEYMEIEDVYLKDGKIDIGKFEFSELEIEFVHVYFKYRLQDDYSLQDISVKFSGTDKIVIVGENGAGKSTFVKLLLRIYKPTSGKILLNGIDIQTIDYASYIKFFATVFQDYKLFSFSIKENILFGNENKVLFEKTLEQTKLLSKIMELPQKENTYIYKDFDMLGLTPSGGEEQKIAMARAACQEQSRIVVLDEPTAALDPLAEVEVYNQFSTLYEDKMCIYISHRLACARFCNKILVLKNGELIEEGSVEQLLNTEGEFKKMYNIQKKLYN